MLFVKFESLLLRSDGGCHEGRVTMEKSIMNIKICGDGKLNKNIMVRLTVTIVMITQSFTQLIGVFS